jgi:hypothetical protein
MTCTLLRSALAALCLAAVAAGHAAAQNPAPSPSRADSAAVRAQLQTMMPMFSQMMAAMLQGTLDVLARPETAEQLATFDRNYLDALLHHGFSRDEALRIVVSVGLPLAGTPK